MLSLLRLMKIFVENCSNSHISIIIQLMNYPIFNHHLVIYLIFLLLIVFVLFLFYRYSALCCIVPWNYSCKNKIFYAFKKKKLFVFGHTRLLSISGRQQLILACLLVCLFVCLRRSNHLDGCRTGEFEREEMEAKFGKCSFRNFGLYFSMVFARPSLLCESQPHCPAIVIVGNEERDPEPHNCPDSSHRTMFILKNGRMIQDK